MLLAVLAAASLPVGVAVAIDELQTPTNADAEDPYAAGHGPHEDGYNTNRREIGRGESSLGAYVLYRSSGPEGLCAQIEFPALNPPGGGHAYFSDCADEASSPLNAAMVVEGDSAVTYGLVPEETSRVEVPGLTSRVAAAKIYRGSSTDPRKFFVVSTSPDADGSIRELRDDGGALATQPVPVDQP